MKQPVRAAVLIAALVLVPSSSYAQSTVTDIVSFLVTNQGVPTGDFGRDRAAAEAARDTITRSLLVNLASVPIATSSSGFLYRLNPELGTVERATDSFGGFFIERALTPGAGRASFGVSATTSSFNRLDGLDLRDGSLITIANQFPDEPAPFETESLSLRVKSSTLTVFGSIGVTDRLEIGGALPFVRLTVDGQRESLYRGQTALQASGSATASGVADAALRAKFNIASGRGGGVAVAAEARLPTGNADNLLGAGKAGFRLIAIAGAEHGPLMLSGNAGLVRGGVSNEFMAGAAAGVAVSPRLSLTAEFLARQIAELTPIVLSVAPHPDVAGVETVRLISGDPGRTVAGGIVGFKWNPAGKVVIGANVRWNFTIAGLTAPLTPSVAVEYGF